MIYIEFGDVYDTNRPTVLYENILTDAVLTGSEALGFPVENAVSGTTFDFWRAPGIAPGSIIANFSGARQADCLFIDAHDMGTQGADFQVDYSTNGGATWTPAFDWITADDDEAIMVLFPQQEGNAWRVRQRNGPASIGVAMLGNKLAFDGGIDTRVTTFSHAQNVEVMGGNSIGGQFLGQRVRRRGGNTTLSFPWLTNEFVSGNMRPFEEHYNVGLPFGMALNPQYDRREVAYCWRPDNANEARPTFMEGGVGVDMNLEVDFYAET
jgi:hypothetical protein